MFCRNIGTLDAKYGERNCSIHPVASDMEEMLDWVGTSRQIDINSTQNLGHYYVELALADMMIGYEKAYFACK